MNLKQAMKQFREAEEAISPVVATLLLVLVAAGAAIGFGVFLNGFQKDTQDNVSSDVSSQCLSIAGSSTVFEFTNVAEPLFENSQGGCDIVNNGGGSGAGLQAIGTGKVDIGAMSHDPSSTDLAKYPDLNGDNKKDFGVPELVVSRVGYDAVVPVVAAGHCAAGKAISTDMLRDIWWKNGGYTTDANSVTVTAVSTETPAGASFTWAEVLPTSCSANTNVIQLVSRSDKGGTVDVFCDKLVGNRHTDLCKAPISKTQVWTKKSGATGDPMLGNQDAEALLASAACASVCLGYTSMAGDDTNTGITALKVAGGEMTDDGTETEVAAAAIQATAQTVRDGAAGLATGYVGWRSLVYLTIGEPSGVAKQYLDFVLLPKNNQEISVASGFISLYP